MSATTAPPASVVEYIRSLSPADKNTALVELLSEAMQTHGRGGLVPVRDGNGRSFGYYVPPAPSKEQVEAMVLRMTPEERARGNEALKNPSRTMDMKKFMEEPDPEDQD
jgi:hypothetical protein